LMSFFFFFFFFLFYFFFVRLMFHSVIVATGIVALVDDCIRRRWHQERRPSWMLPAQHLTKSFERMGPRRLIGQVLQRRGSA
jgi:hypothetical protein